LITGNTSVTFQLGYYSGSTWVAVKDELILTYYDNNIVNPVMPIVSYNLSFKIIFGSSVDFSMSFMVGNKTGILYDVLPTESGLNSIVIYIDDKDYSDQQLKYINSVINYKRPVGVSYIIQPY
jgi:hypothetical protein